MNTPNDDEAGKSGGWGRGRARFGMAVGAMIGGLVMVGIALGGGAAGDAGGGVGGGIGDAGVVFNSADDAQSVPSFRQDVIPLLTRFGCNSGGCHGKQAGQNGFKLSLRGYAPEWDHGYLSAEMGGRRLDFAAPERSLIVLKATGQVAHEGGKRFEKDSRGAKLLGAWVAGRAPGPDAAEADAARLELSPGGRRLKVGETVKLSARAHWPDGRSRDVTWLAQFFSNDETTVSVTAEGEVKALRAGEAAVRVHFQGLVEVVLFTMPHEATAGGGAAGGGGGESDYARRNNAIDEAVFAKLAELRIPVSAECDDATYLRRASLDATGTLPTPEAALAFLEDKSPDKRAKLVDQLLASPEWVDYWTMQLCDLLQNRKERDHDVRGAKNVRAFHGWVREQVAKNRPWNETARDLLTATGDVVARPEVGYYVYTIGEKQNVAESDVAESVAQSFLGVRIGCAKCHNHPLEKFTQDDYYRFTAYFSRVSMKRVDPEKPEKGVTTLVVGSREEGEARKEIEKAEKALGEAEAALKTDSATAGAAGDAKAGVKLSGEEKKVAELRKRVEEQRKRLAEARARPPGVTQPRTKKTMTAMPLDRKERRVPAGQDPREALAAWITDPANESFSGSMVNRLWRHYLGVGLVESVDDLRSSNPPSNPQLWATLNREFVSSGYDLKRVMRLILNSRAYQLSSETRPGNEQDRKFHSHYYAKRLPAEVLLDAISSATGVPDTFAGYPVGVRAVQVSDPSTPSYFLTLFGRSDRVTACACERSGDVTLPQLLHVANGEELGRKIKAADGHLAGWVKAVGKDDAKLTELVFLGTVNRLPSAGERGAVKGELAAATEAGEREEVYRDLFWALLNSKEFAFNH